MKLMLEADFAQKEPWWSTPWNHYTSVTIALCHGKTLPLSEMVRDCELFFLVHQLQVAKNTAIHFPPATPLSWNHKLGKRDRLSCVQSQWENEAYSRLFPSKGDEIPGQPAKQGLNLSLVLTWSKALNRNIFCTALNSLLLCSSLLGCTTYNNTHIHKKRKKKNNRVTCIRNVWKMQLSELHKEVRPDIYSTTGTCSHLFWLLFVRVIRFRKHRFPA